MTASLDDARGTLRRTFGHADFRGLQADVFGNVAAGGDALVLMPTGGGKSLCYQIPALLRDGAAVVVSPLIAMPVSLALPLSPPHAPRTIALAASARP